MFMKKLSQVSKFHTTGFTSEQLRKPEKLNFTQSGPIMTCYDKKKYEPLIKYMYFPLIRESRLTNMFLGLHQNNTCIILHQRHNLSA